MLVVLLLLFLLTTTSYSRQTIELIETTAPVSIVFNGMTLSTWNERSLWNTTQISIVHHLNRLCRKNIECEAEYGIANVHLIETIQHGPSAIRLNVTADKPILSTKNTLEQNLLIYNYTALLTDALLQTKLDMEHFQTNRFASSSSSSSEDTLLINRLSRLLFVFLGISLVALIFGLTVCFFQRIRQHSYSKLLKSTRTYQTASDEPLPHSPSNAALHA